MFYVTDAPAPVPENEKEIAEEPEQSALTRREDQSFWQRYVCRGEKLTQASLRNKDTAVKFAKPIDSEWDGTLENELKLWGYTDYDGQSLYCEIGNIAENLANIGVDAKFKHNVKTGQNQCFNIGHRLKSEKTPVRDQTYTVGDKTYRVSIHLNGLILKPELTDISPLDDGRILTHGSQCSRWSPYLSQRQICRARCYSNLEGRKAGSG